LGAGGRWFKSNRPDQFKTRRLAEINPVADSNAGVNFLAVGSLRLQQHVNTGVKQNNPHSAQDVPPLVFFFWRVDCRPQQKYSGQQWRVFSVPDKDINHVTRSVRLCFLTDFGFLPAIT
jgi:hypothetical protein